MKRLSRNAALVSVSAVLLILLIAILLAPSEPVYQGQPLSFWVGELENPDPARSQQAKQALGDLGTQAVPFLLREARNVRSPLRFLYREAWFRLPIALRRKLPQPESTDDALHKISHALHELGPEAGPVLMMAMEDRNGDVRSAAAAAFPYNNHPSSNVLWLAKMLRTPDYELKQSAAGMLACVGTNALPAIPALLHVILHDEIDYVRETAARSLATLARPGMDSAVADLAGCLDDLSAPVRVWSAIALWRINRNTNAISVLVADLKRASAEDGSSHAVVRVLGEAGALAKEAVPEIRALMLAYNPERALPEGAGPLIQAAREALRQIEPEAVPEFDVPVP